MRLILPEQFYRIERMEDAATKIMAKHKGVTLAIIRGEARSKWIVKARTEMVVYFRDILGKSYPQIAKFMRRDPTSCLHLYRKHQREILEQRPCPHAAKA
ncbi:MAG: helix-turn-helix domain-containing protein [Agrobacterium sp.]|uniref:helix-turn-helix domain-containing protein n=1 Tax=Agrobacterium sp. TaxID=361 RepID=UPI0040334DBA